MPIKINPIVLNEAEAESARRRIFDTSMPEPNSGCWLWMGFTSKGYGSLSFGGKIYYAHRLSYVAHGKTTHENTELDHKCRVPCCVNPDHLESVSHAENVRRGATVSRNKCRNGHIFPAGAFSFMPTSAGVPKKICLICRDDGARRYRAKKGHIPLREWDPKFDLLIMENWKKISPRAIGEMVGFSRNTVNRRAVDLGLQTGWKSK